MKKSESNSDGKVMSNNSIITSELNLSPKQVGTAVQLFESGATIPFVARYRKDQTGGLDEVMLLKIKQEVDRLAAFDDRRKYILKTLREAELLTPEIEKQLSAAGSLTELEDLYLPFKKKRQSKAEKARKAGLEPLAKMIMAQGPKKPELLAKSFVRGTVNSTDVALQGAVDIIAGWVNEHLVLRKRLRKLFFQNAEISAKVAKGKEEEGQQFRDYFNYSESVSKIKPHRVLALFRAEKLGVLSVGIAPDRQQALKMIAGFFIRKPSPSSGIIERAVSEAYTRLLRPAMQTEVKNHLKEKADESAINVFAGNLRQLLLSPPLGEKRVMAIDPGFKSGCKVVCLDEQGKLLGHDTIFPHPPQKKTNAARNTLHSLINTHKVEVVAIGNGTAGRETEDFIKRTAFKRELAVYMVNEDGASVYSASSIGRKEFPNHDVTIRGAVSIGRRLMDPLAELVKIDPQSIGIGQYQHDVDESKLKSSLDQCVSFVVNEVGVELNTASPYLLAHISGLGPALAEQIVQFREGNGAFSSRAELKKVPRLGPKAFEQSAGFLRISSAKNPLDNSAVHPESYPLAEKIARHLGYKLSEIMENEELLGQLDASKLDWNEAGEYTLQDLLSELKKPRRDPRRKAYIVEFDRKINRPEDLIEGAEMWGVVTNITNFGAFVDIGVKQDGLVHISELADRFVSDPFEIVKLNQPVKVKVLSVDIGRKRIALSMKQATVLEPPV